MIELDTSLVWLDDASADEVESRVDGLDDSPLDANEVNIPVGTLEGSAEVTRDVKKDSVVLRLE